MADPIVFIDKPENFYGELKELIQSIIRKEISGLKKEESEVIYIKKDEVCKLLRVSKPTVDSHVEKGYYQKHCMGSRVFYNKQEILAYLQQGNSLSQTQSSKH